jgi:hypothetical protein
MKTTYENLIEVTELLNKIPLNDEKLRYAVLKNSTKYNRIFKKYQEELFDINLEYCEVYKEGDKKGTIIKDTNGEFVFTKENTKARDKAIKALKASEIEIDPYYATLTVELVKCSF